MIYIKDLEKSIKRKIKIELSSSFLSTSWFFKRYAFFRD